jgi:hypothetical protein
LGAKAAAADAELVEVAVVLVLPEDEREKFTLPLVDSVPCDCSDRRDMERCLLTMMPPELEGLEVCEGARLGISGLVTGMTGWPGAVKY